MAAAVRGGPKKALIAAPFPTPPPPPQSPPLLHRPDSGSTAFSDKPAGRWPGSGRPRAGSALPSLDLRRWCGLYVGRGCCCWPDAGDDDRPAAYAPFPLRGGIGCPDRQGQGSSSPCLSPEMSWAPRLPANGAARGVAGPHAPPCLLMAGGQGHLQVSCMEPGSAAAYLRHGAAAWLSSWPTPVAASLVVVPAMPLQCVPTILYLVGRSD